MTLFIEIITVLWKTVWGILSAFVSAIWDALPFVVEIKKILGNFTPTSVIAFWFGVPSIVITILIFVLKKIIKSAQ